MTQPQLMWRLMRYRPRLYALTAVLWIAIHLSPLVPGLLAREFFATLEGRATLDVGVWGIVVLIGMTALARVALIYAGIATDILMRFSLSGLVRRNLLERLLSAPAGLQLAGAGAGAGAGVGPGGAAGAAPGAGRPSTGEALSGFRDDVQQVEDSVDWTIDVAGTALFALVATAILLGIDARITLLVFLPLVGVVAAVRLLGARLTRYRAAAREATARVTGALGEMFSAVQAVQVAGAEERVIAHLRERNEQRYRLSMRDGVLTQVVSSVFANTVSLGTGAILLLAARSMRSGAFGVGDFALFVYYLAFVTEFTQFFGTFLAHYRQTGVSFGRLERLMAGAPPAPAGPAAASALVRAAPLHLSGPPPPAPPVPGAAPAEPLRELRVEGLTCRHPGTGEGIRDVSFSVEGGSLTVITGRIGAGKTTLLRALLGLIPAEAGTVRWNGRVVADRGAFFVPPRSAYTPQLPLLVSGSLRENVLLGWPEEHADLAGALHSAALERDVAELHAGLETRIGPRGVALSGGQRKRAAAARMFARRAALLAIDDLSGELDAETEHVLLERLRAQRGRTLLAVSHRRPVIERADRVVVLAGGRVEAVGRPDEVLAQSAELRELLRE